MDEYVRFGDAPMQCRGLAYNETFWSFRYAPSEHVSAILEKDLLGLNRLLRGVPQERMASWEWIDGIEGSSYAAGCDPAGPNLVLVHRMEIAPDGEVRMVRL